MMRRKWLVIVLGSLETRSELTYGVTGCWGCVQVQ